MSKRRLNEKQYAAIEFLALPKRGGMTYEEIAAEVGVTDRTLRNWRKDETFNKALKEAIVRNTIDRLPDIFDAAIDGVITDKNAAMFRTILQAHGLLTDKLEVETKGDNVVNTEELREKLRKIKEEG